MKLVKKLVETSDKFQQFVNVQLKNPFLRKLDLETFLMKPFQRLTRYPLLLQEIIRAGVNQKEIDIEEDEKLLVICTKEVERIVAAANTRQGWEENLVKIREIQEKLTLDDGATESSTDISDNIEMGLVTGADNSVTSIPQLGGTQRVFVKEGDIKLLCGSVNGISDNDSVDGVSNSTLIPGGGNGMIVKRKIIVFDDIILFVKVRSKTKYLYKFTVNVQNLSVIAPNAVPSGEELLKGMKALRKPLPPQKKKEMLNPDLWFVLGGSGMKWFVGVKTADEKREWIDSLNDVIVKSMRTITNKTKKK